MLTLAPPPPPPPSLHPWRPDAVPVDASRPSLEAAFARARAGSPDGWADVYEVARPQLYRFARLRLASDDQAEDAVSETVARAIAVAHRYRPGAGPLPWLVGICRNVVREAHRSGGRLRSVDPSSFVERPSVAPEAGPAERTVLADEARTLRLAFARLDDEEQELLSLRVVVGLDASAVGEVVGKRAGAVRMAQSRALDRLRAYVEEAR